MGRIAISTSVVIAVITGVALLGFSPAGCSCISPVDMLSFQAGYSAPGTLLSPAALEAGLDKTLHGRPLAPHVLGDDHCRQTTPERVVCRIPVHTSPLLARGLDVTYQASGAHITHVSVARAVWLNY
jgi:hypothetical protein